MVAKMLPIKTSIWDSPMGVVCVLWFRVYPYRALYE